MNKIMLMLAAGLLLSSGAIARAEDYVVLERTARDFDTWGMRPDGRERVVTVISGETGVPITTLDLQRQQTGLGYGGLFIANSLASATGRSFDEIVARKAGGEGWGRIAQDYGVKLGPIVSRAHRADASFHNGNGKLKKFKKGKHGHDDFGSGNGHGHRNNKGFGHSNGKGYGGGHGHKG